MGDKHVGTTASSELVYLLEGELLAWVTDSFYGEVIHVENIEIVVGRYSEYRAIITIKVLDPFVTTFQKEELVTLLVPNQIDTNIGVTANATYSDRLRKGQKAIILGIRYDESSIYETDGSTLYLQELAQLGLPDGTRFVMIETAEQTFQFSVQDYPS